MTESTEPIYTSRIIKASALIADTKVLLSEWNLAQSVSENLGRARRQNIFGKASRSRIEDILIIFRQRYFDDTDVGTMLVTLLQAGAPAQWLDPLLYFFTAQNDRTLRDLVVDVIYPRHRAGYVDLPVEVVIRAIRNWVAAGKTTTPWKEQTIERVAQGVMATLRDFGVLQGAANKQIAPVYLPTPSFALIALWLQGRERSGDRVLHSDDWKLFFLPPEGVERFFVEAHQEHLLAYHAAGSVIRIEFPAPTLTEVADVLLESAR
ncbi:MAG: BrxA family protein [Chloroflexota bacterium]